MCVAVCRLWCLELEDPLLKPWFHMLSLDGDSQDSRSSAGVWFDEPCASVHPRELSNPVCSHFLPRRAGWGRGARASGCLWLLEVAQSLTKVCV